IQLTMDGNHSVTATFALANYSLSLSTSGSGSATKSPDQATYTYGSVVTVTATPTTGWHFVGWSGDTTAATNPLTFTMIGNRSLTATFAINTYTLAVATSGLGSVTKSPDQPTYNYGAAVTVTATPAAGWHSVGWSGDTTTAASSLSLTMTANRSFTATFAINTYTLAVATVGSGTVVKSPDQPTYDYGTAVTVTATPAAGWHSVGWSGDTTTAASSLSLTMTANRSFTATFAINTYTLAVATVGSGTVVKSPDQPTYDYGTAVTVTATPAAGWHSVGWSGDTTTAASSLSLTMTANRSFTATFAINTYTLAVATVGSGTVVKSPDQPTYDYGAAVTVTATPATGWHFVGWSGDTTTAAASLSLTMTANRSFTATFAINTYTLTVTSGPNGTVSKNPDQPTYNYGSTVTLTATPATGYHLASWGGDASGSTNPLSVTMDGHKTITATLALNTYPPAAT